MASFIPTSHITPTAKIYPVAGDTHKKIQLCICFLSNDKQKLTLNYKENPEAEPIHIVSLIIEKPFDKKIPFFNFKILYNILNTSDQNFSEFKMDKDLNIILSPLPEILSPLKVNLKVKRLMTILRGLYVYIENIENIKDNNDLNKLIKKLINSINTNADISNNHNDLIENKKTGGSNRRTKKYKYIKRKQNKYSRR